MTRNRAKDQSTDLIALTGTCYFFLVRAVTLSSR